MKTYCIRTGVMFNDDGTQLFDGCYAGGFKGTVPEAINDPDYCSVKNTGPIPPGVYTIGEPYQNPNTGSHTMNLTPDESNEMFGRGDFRCHGDNPAMNRSASDGCIIRSPANIRCQIYTQGEKRLTVVREAEDVQGVYSPAPAPIVAQNAQD